MEPMNWCFGSGVNDFLVPKDQEILDGPPPSESWMQWGRTDYETMESLSKYIVPEENPIPEVHMGKVSLHQSTLPHGQPNCFLNDRDGSDYADDIFMSSLLDEDLSAIESLNESFGFSPEFQCSSTLTDDPLIVTVLDSCRVPSHSCSRKSSEYIQTDDFSPSRVGKKEECTSMHYAPSNLGKRKICPPVMEPKVKIPVLAKQSGAWSEETSVEESVLQELEGAMRQFTQKGRICFRDALYRLAKNSEQQSMLTEGHATEFTTESTNAVDEIPRSGTGKAMEPETNAIDRAVANLMFNKMGINAQNVYPSASVHTAPSGGDAEVPVIGSRGNLQRTTNRHFQALVQ